MTRNPSRTLRLAALLAFVLPLAACGNKGPLLLPPASGNAPPPAPAADALPPETTVMPAPGVSVAPGTSVELRDDALDSHDDADATPPPTEDNDGTPGTPR